MANKHQEFVQWVMKQAATAPVKERIMAYRGLAEVCGSVEQTKTLLGLAVSLEQAEIDHLAASQQMDLQGLKGDR